MSSNNNFSVHNIIRSPSPVNPHGYFRQNGLLEDLGGEDINLLPPPTLEWDSARYLDDVQIAFYDNLCRYTNRYTPPQDPPRYFHENGLFECLEDERFPWYRPPPSPAQWELNPPRVVTNNRYTPPHTSPNVNRYTPPRSHFRENGLLEQEDDNISWGRSSPCAPIPVSPPQWDLYPPRVIVNDPHLLEDEVIIINDDNDDDIIIIDDDGDDDGSSTIIDMYERIETEVPVPMSTQERPTVIQWAPPAL